jgi:hypothetical protein
MAVARTHSVALIGTNETTTQSISNNASQTGSEVDLLGDDTSVGNAWFFLFLTSTVTAGTVDVKINSRRTGQAYSKVNFERSIVPTNGNQRIPLGRLPVSRYGNVEIKNNATGASCSVSLIAEVEKVS